MPSLLELEAPSIKLDRHGANREVKPDQLVKGFDGNIYQVDAVFASGKVALTRMRPNDSIFSRTQTGYVPTEASSVRDTSFISAVQIPCTSNKICVGDTVEYRDLVEGCKAEIKNILKHNLSFEEVGINPGPDEKCQYVKYQKVLVCFSDDTVATSMMGTLVGGRNLAPADENRKAADLIIRGAPTAR